MAITGPAHNQDQDQDREDIECDDGSMSGFLLTVFGLALAGLDPIVAFAAVAALTAGAHRRAVVAFGIVALAVPMVIGIGLSLLLSAGSRLVELPEINWYASEWAILEIAVAIALIWWAIKRGHRPHKRAEQQAPRTVNSLALIGLAAFLGSTVAVDPTFLGVAVLAGQKPLWAVIVAHVGYSLISQSPLVIVTIATAMGKQQKVVDAMIRFRERFGPLLRHGLTAILYIVSLVLLIDGIMFILSDGTKYLLG